MPNNNGKQLATKMDNAPKPAEIFDPQLAVDQATIAAKTLKDIVDRKQKKVIINGEQFLEYEDWQTLGRFYGYTVETGDGEEIWREGELVGYKAKATVHQAGIKIGGAEASCMRDEPNWSSKPEFQWKSMAQTRAGAKALRNVLAWVAVLAGYRPTPAEEMNGNPKPIAEGATEENQEPRVRPSTIDRAGKIPCKNCAHFYHDPQYATCYKCRMKPDWFKQPQPENNEEPA
jgi:hypothetical protein